MIHPQAAADSFLAPLHRSFLISSIVSGAAALVVLPLHLALAGPPQAAEILVLAWLLCQWPLALYLSQSGNLNRAVGLSSTLFACFVAAVCFLSGGSQSFAFVWLLIPPVEAAFSTNRKTAISVAAICGALLAAMTFLPALQPQLAPLPETARFVTSLAALAYAGMLAFRISADRRRAQMAVQRSENRRQMMSQSVSEVFCELDPDGRIRVMGGPVKQIFGAFPASAGEDWLFQRLHVADRPLYLTSLSDVRHSGAPALFEVRLRVGASAPGEAGRAEYRRLQLHLRPAAQDGSRVVPSPEGRLLLSIRQPEERFQQSGSEAAVSLRETRTGRISRTLLEHAGNEARRVFSEITAQASLLESKGEGLPEGLLRDAALQMKAAGEAGLERLSTVLDFLPEAEAGTQTDYAMVDVASCLEQCIKLMEPIAGRNGIFLDLEARQDLPRAVADEKRLRQAFCFILSDMVDTSGNGAVVSVSSETGQGGLEVLLSVRNRQSSLSWSAETSRPVLDFAGELLERSGGSLAVLTTLGQGESIVVRLPVRSNPAMRDSSAQAVAENRPLAKTA